MCSEDVLLFLLVPFQPYIDQSEADRNRYLQEVEEYQKTDSYKKYMKTITGKENFISSS